MISVRRIAGVDEVGRGPLAGPVVAAAVVFPAGYSNKEFKDSKKLSAKKRDNLSEVIKEVALDWAIVSVGHKRIDQLNIRNAAKLAMSLAVARITADFVLVDGNMEIDTDLPQQTVVKGDALCVEISAASIIAKVWRDNLMQVLDKRYPIYGFSKHMGYPTSLHRDAISSSGYCAVHRRTFSGVKEYCLAASPVKVITSQEIKEAAN